MTAGYDHAPPNPDPWVAIMADPRSRAALDKGLADLAAGRVRRWRPRPARWHRLLAALRRRHVHRWTNGWVSPNGDKWIGVKPKDGDRPAVLCRDCMEEREYPAGGEGGFGLW